ncbi:MAG: hypothetical protein WCO14_02880 [bacterium]
MPNSRCTLQSITRKRILIGIIPKVVRSATLIPVPKRCKYIWIIKKGLLRGSNEEIYEIVCRAGEEKLLGTPGDLNLPCATCEIGRRLAGAHCKYLEAEKVWNQKGDIVFICGMIKKRGINPDQDCPRCNDYELILPR